ncbi:rRNA adenine N-6-methyltransferase family protein, partial [Acinetobacter baumannii]
NPNDYVIEIGPGLGALTEKLVQQAAYVTAIEKDLVLSEFLKSELALYPHFHLITADAKTFAFKDYIEKHCGNNKIILV